MGGLENDKKETALTVGTTTSITPGNNNIGKTLTTASAILQLLQKKEEEQKEVEEKEKQHAEQEAQLQLIKNLTKQFNAYYIDSIVKNPDWFYIKNVEGSYIITKDGKILAGPHQEPRSNNRRHMSYFNNSVHHSKNKEGSLMLNVRLPDDTLQTIHLTAEKTVVLPYYDNITRFKQGTNMDGKIVNEYLIEENHHAYIIDEDANRISDLYNQISYDAKKDIVTGCESEPDRSKGIIGYSAILVKNEYGKYEHQGMHFYIHSYEDGRTLCRGDRSYQDIGWLYDKDGKLVIEGPMLPRDGHMCGVEIFPMGDGKFTFVEDSGTRVFENIKEVIYPKFRTDYFDDGDRINPVIITNENRVMLYDTESSQIVDPILLPMTPMFNNTFRKYSIGDDNYIITDETNKIVDRGHFEFFTYDEYPLGSDKKEERIVPTLIKKIVSRTYNHPEGRKSKYVLYDENMKPIPEIYDEFRSYNGGDCIIAIQEGRYCLINIAQGGKKVSDIYYNIVPWHAGRYQASMKEGIKEERTQDGHMPRDQQVLLNSLGEIVLGPVHSVHIVNNLIAAVQDTEESDEYFIFLDGTRVGA